MAAVKPKRWQLSEKRCRTNSLAGVSPPSPRVSFCSIPFSGILDCSGNSGGRVPGIGLSSSAAYWIESWRRMGDADRNLDEQMRGVEEPECPYAADTGLELWEAIRSWNEDYIDIIYMDDSAAQGHVELQK